ncbi:leucine-rich_repeat domain-containing protein [Hexamita inflata]|nr:leucine-rich repeat domain-containing protein [Hexamita inflata]
MSLNFVQKEIDFQYYRRNMSRDITQEQMKQYLEGLVGNIIQYRQEYLDFHDQYFTQKYGNIIQLQDSQFKQIENILMDAPIQYRQHIQGQLQQQQEEALLQFQQRNQEIQQNIEIQRNPRILRLRNNQLNNQHEQLQGQQDNYQYKLSISNEECLRDVYFVKFFEQYETLVINQCCMVNFSRTPLNVKDLRVNECKLKSVEGIQQMTNLASLNISNNQLVDISQLQFLVKLKFLDVSQNQIIYLQPLCNLQLTEININTNFIPNQQLQFVKRQNPIQRVQLQHHQGNLLHHQGRTQRQLNVSQQLYYKKLLAIDKLKVTYSYLFQRHKSINKLFKTMTTKVRKLLWQNVTQLTFIASKTVVLIQNFSGPFE